LRVKNDGDSIPVMFKTAYVIDERYEAHRAAPGHPERPERIRALLDALNSYRRDGMVRIEPRTATEAELLSNHSQDLVNEVRESAEKESYVFDADTQACAATYETARLAAGGVLALLDAVVEGVADNGFALVRPPGHHAEADRVMGFCFFNNIAIAARYLQERHRVRRLLIMDWDVHHGNGTQRSFYASRDVLYISTHQYPFYPGTGAATEVGVTEGMGYTVNLPFPGGFGDAEYAEAFARIVEPIAHQFEPEFVLISAGFDAHRLDPLGGMNVTAAGFSRMAQGLLSVARAHAGGRCAAVLEGGYSLRGLAEGVVAVLDEMGLANEPEPDKSESSAGALLTKFSDVHRRYWRL
jgi:acetoin utilization deacetylase AcuC-like enzyme